MNGAAGDLIGTAWPSKVIGKKRYNAMLLGKLISSTHQLTQTLIAHWRRTTVRNMNAMI